MAAFCYTMRMNLKVPLLALAALAAVTGAAEDVVIENAAFRLVISQDGAATSLVAKAMGEDVPPPYWYNVPRAQKRVWDHIRTKPRGAESALKSHFGWHMLSRGNAFDSFYPERTRQSLDKYILPAARLAADDFSTVDFGWLRLFLPGEKIPRKATFLANNNFGDAIMSVFKKYEDLKFAKQQDGKVSP